MSNPKKIEVLERYEVIDYTDDLDLEGVKLVSPTGEIIDFGFPERSADFISKAGLLNDETETLRNRIVELEAQLASYPPEMSFVDEQTKVIEYWVERNNKLEVELAQVQATAGGLQMRLDKHARINLDLVEENSQLKKAMLISLALIESITFSSQKTQEAGAILRKALKKNQADTMDISPESEQNHE